jgi:hypothetical protein
LQLFFMSTAVQPLALTSSSALSNLQMLNVRLGSFATDAAHAEIHRCPLRPKTDHQPLKRSLSQGASSGHAALARHAGYPHRKSISNVQ